MAAPMKYARISLTFENLPINPSWLLVDFERHISIASLHHTIRSRHDISQNADISLWLKNAILPEQESSQLLRDDDVVAVRVTESHEEKETVKNSRKRKHNDSGEALTVGTGKDLEHDIFDVAKRKKKKKKHQELEDVEILIVNNQKTKHREKGNESQTERKQCEELNNAHQLEKKKKKKSSKGKSKEAHSCDSERPDQNVETDTGKAVNDLGKAESESGDTDQTNGTADPDTKSKRKRRRRHKRKKKTHNDNISTPVETNKITEPLTSSAAKSAERPKSNYVGKPVEKEEMFYGCLPDKLEPPKYYRHGYRNMKTYEAKPNSHKTFDSDSDSEVEEGSLEQYNFLCKSKRPGLKKTPVETSVNEKLDISTLSAGDLSTLFSISPNINSEVKGQFQDAYAPNDSSLNSQYFNDFDIKNNHIDTESQQVLTDNSRTNIYDQADQHVSQSPVSRPDIGYSRMNPEVTSASLSASPTLLERKTLASGVTVFSRQRNNTPKTSPARFHTLSKEDQLNDVATNVSTIFVNPSEDDFKVPASPKIERASKPSTPTVSPMTKSAPASRTVPQQSSPSNGCQANSGLDLAHKPVLNGSVSHKKTGGAALADLPMLQGLPAVGQKIAYKVLEMSANCTPEVSDFKLAEVLSVGEDQMIELRNVYQSAKEPNRFSMEIEYEDEILTNMDQPQEMVSLHVSSMMDMRIIS